MVDQPRDRLGRFLSPEKDKSHLGFYDKFGGRLGDFLEAAEKAGHKISIFSGYRSPARQKQLFDAAVAKYGSVSAARKMVAPPGKSKHNLGLAADLKYATPEAEAWAHANAKKFGLNFRMSWEPWHIEPLGKIGKLGLGMAALLDPNRMTLPETVRAPQFREDALSQAAQQEAIASAFRDPMRALDVIPSKLSAPALASQYAQYQRATVPSPPSIPSAPTSGVYRDMIDTAQWSPAGFARPALANEAVSRALSAPSMPSGLSRPAPPSVSRQTASMPVGLSRPAPPSVSPSLAQAAGTPTAGYNAKAQAAGTPTAGYDAKAQPAGTPTQGYDPTGPSAADLAGQYGQYRTPTNYTNVRNAMLAQPMSLEDQKTAAAYTQYGLTKALAPVTPVAPPPALQAPPAQVLAPVLAPRPVHQVAPVSMPPAPPAAKAYDVYSGMAESAMDNTGQNTIGRLQDGTTTVTNKYGVTTGMTPYGKQTAIGSLPGISAPDLGKFGQSVKGAVPTVAGSVAGGLLAGPLGALLGGLIAKEATKPGGLLNRQSFQTNAFGTINAAKAQGGLGFPSAPSGGYGNRNASFSNRSMEGMRSISPGAAAAIGAGKGGLY
jgi:hypothetical protein